MIGAVARAFPDGHDPLELPRDGDPGPILAAAGFDARMRAAFAVVIVAPLLETDLRGTLPGEIATRSRQAGVACHAICAERELDAFGARIYDLQTITTTSAAGLRTAASELAARL